MNRNKFIKPDWGKCNINISATLAEFLGAPNKNSTLPVLKESLKKDFKNVVFICFDGLGIYPIEKNLAPDNFLRKNIVQTLTSTFPSTTNATTSLANNQLPLEHGWFGWSMHFKDLNRNINIFLNSDSWTNEKIEIAYSPLGEIDYYFDNATSNHEISTVFPNYVKVSHHERNHIFSGQADFFETIQKICNRNGKQFIYAYYPEPDQTMHEFGVTSNEAKAVITSISKSLQELLENTKNTLYVITADHGQIDVEGYVELYKDKKLYEMLEIYPFLEARAVAFKVKKGRKEEFEKYFKSKYGEDFKLYKTKELLRANIFGGFGLKADLLGDYIAVGTYTHKIALIKPDSHAFKGHHASLTEEMLVPLIVIENA